MKSVHNTLKIEEKFSDVSKKFRVGPKKVGSVGFPETGHFFFFGLSDLTAWPINEQSFSSLCVHSSDIIYIFWGAVLLISFFSACLQTGCQHRKSHQKMEFVVYCTCICCKKTLAQLQYHSNVSFLAKNGRHSTDIATVWVSFFNKFMWTI